MKETELTNLMYELLSPIENPECGRLYLELFDKNVLRLNMTAEELDSAKVHGQYETKLLAKELKISSKKMDLAIITSRRFIPVEVKIESGSHKDQCDSYLYEAQLYTDEYSLSEPPILYYLTLHGYFPERRSATNTGYGDSGDLAIHQDKIIKVTFRTELLPWLEDCAAHSPENFSCRNKLSRLLSEVRKLTRRTNEQLQVEDIMRKIFMALDERFDESFCKRYRLKRRMIQTFEDSNWQREILKFFFKGHCAPYINFHCTDSTGNIIKFGADKELLFGAECYNGGENDFKQTRIFGADFAIYDKSIGNYIGERTDIKRLLDGKNILPQEFIKEYWQKGQKLAGCIGRRELHDAHGNTIDFKNVAKTLTQFDTQEDIDAAVDNIMTEIETLLRRFVYG